MKLHWPHKVDIALFSVGIVLNFFHVYAIAGGAEYFTLSSVSLAPNNNISAAFADQQLNTLKLSDLISGGIEANPSVEAKLRQSDAAKHGISAAKWQFFPTPSVSIQQAHASKNDPNYQGSNRVYQFGVQQPLWTGGRLTSGLSSAEKQYAISLIDVEDVKESVALRLATAFGDWKGFDYKSKISQEAVDSYNRLLGLIRRRIDSGLSPENDYLFARGRLDQALAELESAKAQREIALNSLTRLMGGVGVDAALLRRINSTALDYSVTPDVALMLAEEHRPAILRARAQKELLDSQVNLTKSSLSPTISIVLQRQNGNFSYSNVVTNGENLGFLVISSNFGAGLSSYSQVAAASSQRQSALLDEENAVLGAKEEVNSTLALLKSTQSRIASLQSSCSIASATSESWQRQFLAGRKAWQDLLNSVREISSCKSSVADAKQSLLVLNWKLAIYIFGVDGALSLASHGGW